jgi:hypothetical protein
MKAFHFLRTVPVAFFAIASVATAASGPAHRQSAEEVEDIGVIAEAGAGATNGKTDAKSVPPPEPVKHFRFNVGTRAQYTSNAKMTGDHDSNDVIFFPSIEFGYNTKLGQYFSFDSALRVDSGLYSDNTNRSFIGYSLQNTLDFRPKSYLPRVFIGFEPYRYDSYHKKGLITEALALSVGTDYGYSFNNGHTLAFVGYTFANHFSHPNGDSRRVNTTTAGLTHSFNPMLTGQLYYQFEYSNFYEVARDDARHVAGLSLTYQLTRRIFTTLSGNWVNNDSSDERASYQSVGASLGFNVQY